MCLVTEERRPRIAEEDIVCYKRLEYKNEGEVKTPFQGMPIGDDILNGEKPLVAEGEKDVTKTTTVGGGYIHTYKKMEYIQDTNTTNSMGIKTYKCIIPKGTEYWSGANGDYASSEIKFVSLEEDIIPEEK